MTMSWEIREQRKVLAYTLHTEVVSTGWAAGFRKLMIPGDHFFVSGMPFDHARNHAVQVFLNSPYQWLLSLDSDVIPPADGIHRLLACNEPIISGLYARRSPPHAVPVMMRNGQWVTSYVPGSIMEVDLVGAGFLLMHRSVFDRLPHQRPGHPWFDWRVNMKGHMPESECLSEDFTLCVHAKRHGYRVLVHTGIVCRHAGWAEAMPGSYTPLNHAA